MPDNANRIEVLFPEIDPYAIGRLAVDARHTLYWETCGNPDGVPLVFLHGGPGGASLPHHRRYYDPSFWRIVLFDQRGAGRSTPAADLTDNTTRHLVADIERLREHLRIDKWLLFGGSWGSTLALAYAQAHPERCLGLVLRGIFLARPSELDWFMHGMRIVFPEAWRAFVEFLPAAERADILGELLPAIDASGSGRSHAGGARLGPLRGLVLEALPPADPMPSFDSDTSTLAIARIEAHYFVHGAFLGDDELLANLFRIRKLPCSIVQGRYDIICPPITADTLARAWPEAEYIVVPDAGHSVREPGIARELVGAVRRMQARLRR